MGLHTSFYPFSLCICLRIWRLSCEFLYKKYEDGDDDFIEKYYALLEAGGSVHYQNHLSKFKLNPKRRDFATWNEFN